MRKITTLLLIVLFTAVGNYAKAQDFMTAISGSTDLPIVFEQSPECPWLVGDGCVSSSNIVGLKTSWFSATVDIIKTGVLSFDYKVESGGWGEAFKFSVNGIDSISIQQSRDWTHVSFNLNKGENIFKWVYTLSGGWTDSYAYIKNLKITGANVEEPFFYIFDPVVKFGDKLLNTITTKSIEFVNCGNKDLLINQITGLSSPLNVVSYPKSAIKKGQKAVIEVSFSPEIEGYWQQKIRIETNGNTQTTEVKALCSKGYTVEVSTAGGLSSLVENIDCDSLTVYGYLNDKDFTFIKQNLKLLKYLNIQATEVANSKIPNYALNENRQIEEIIFPYNIEVIGYAAFDRCSSLKKVILPNSVHTIEGNGFSECTSLASINFPDSLVYIGETAFDYLPVQTIQLPVKVKEIGYSAFSYCKSLRNITLPDSLEIIRSNAFYSCSALTSIEIPANVKIIENNAFYSTWRLTDVAVKALVPPATSGGNFEYAQVIQVPATVGKDYKAAPFWKDKIILAGEKTVDVIVDVQTAGTLGQEILKQLEYVREVNRLTIKGVLNEDDFYQIRTQMPDLISIDLSGVKMDNLPDHFFEKRYGLRIVILPDSLKTIGFRAFGDCRGLTEMVIPSSVTTLLYNCFERCYALHTVQLPKSLKAFDTGVFSECYSLTSIDIPIGVETISDYVFQKCWSLSSVKLPSNLKAIKNYAFYECSALDSISFPSSLETIDYYGFRQCTNLKYISFPASSKLSTLGDDAFGKCTSLKEVTLPASLNWCSTPFQECSNLKKITCYASIPPVLDGNYDPLYSADKTDCELYVPYWSLNNYKLTPGWDVIPTIKPINEDMKDIFINRGLTFADTIRPKNNPNVTLYDQGKFTVNGTSTLSLGNYIQNHKTSLDWYGNIQWNYSSYTSLVTESDGMRADSVEIRVLVDNRADNKWIYFSVPFDTKVSDLDIPESVLYVIYRYDGAVRATSGSGQSWKKLSGDDLLNANEGYIIQFNQRNVNSFGLTALNNENKNKIFTATDQSLPLKEYTSEFIHNRSWNFVGNPYPCFFDIRYMDYQAPITVRNGDGYKALSLTDDSYVLKPMEAFFVQKPVDADAIIFHAEGRQHESTVKERTSVVKNAQIANQKRDVYNLSFGNDEFADETRLVLNSKALITYEMDKDASKFMSENQKLPQLYTLESGVAYAINERPEANRIIALGIHVGEDGLYTFKMNHVGGVLQDIYLIDKETNQKILLNHGDYSIRLSVGGYTQRFELRIGTTPTGITDLDSDNTSVSVYDHQIKVRTMPGSDISVYSVTGQLLNERKAQDNEASIMMEPGSYVVVVNGCSFKVLVIE